MILAQVLTSRSISVRVTFWSRRISAIHVDSLRGSVVRRSLLVVYCVKVNIGEVLVDVEQSVISSLYYSRSVRVSVVHLVDTHVSANTLVDIRCVGKEGGRDDESASR